jgi:hypothetical protein
VVSHSLPPVMSYHPQRLQANMTNTSDEWATQHYQSPRSDHHRQPDAPSGRHPVLAFAFGSDRWASATTIASCEPTPGVLHSPILSVTRNSGCSQQLRGRA